MDKPDIGPLVEKGFTRIEEYVKIGDTDSAIEIAKQILKVDPSQTKAKLHLVTLFFRKGIGDEATRYALECVAENPGPESYNALGLALSVSGDCSGAIKYFKKAISEAPDQSCVASNLAMEYDKAGMTEESDSVFSESCERFPDCKHTRFNWATCLYKRGATAAAERLYREVISIDPGFAAAHYNLSACLFLRGEYTEAWPEYEWRWRQFPYFDGKRKSTGIPEWKGQKTRTLRLYCEQGLGDLIHFSRYIDLAREKCEKIILDCPAPCRPLMETCDGVDAFSGEADFQASVVSLPRLLYKPKPFWPGVYLLPGKTCPGWERYEDFIKIGLCWAGSPIHPRDHERSCYLRSFDFLCDFEDVKLFSLQKDLNSRVRGGKEVDYTEGAEHMNMVDMRGQLEGMDRLASVICQMDLVVTVDTMVAHLAGALGKPVINLITFVPDWRWGLSGESTPWYPSMILARQEKAGDWSAPLRLIKDKVTSLLS